MKIAVYAISKNEAQFAERFARSCADADCVIVADTGSTDNTRAALEACGVTVHDICIAPWRFDRARDAALALVPADVDVCISLDLDELLTPGWRAELERVWTPNTTRLRYQYAWGPGVQFGYEKIHARRGYHWHHPCHEYPRPDGRTTEVWAETDALLVQHRPDPTKSRASYRDLLALSVEEDPSCPRNAFYYARELTFYGAWADAIPALERYLAMPAASWAHERAYAMRLLGRAYATRGDESRATAWFERGTRETPQSREAWVAWAQYAYEREDWATCYHAASTAVGIKTREHVYTADPAVWGAWPHDLAAISAYHLQLTGEALSYGRAACACAPEDTRLQENLSHYFRAFRLSLTPAEGLA